MLKQENFEMNHINGLKKNSSSMIVEPEVPHEIYKKRLQN